MVRLTEEDAVRTPKTVRFSPELEDGREDEPLYPFPHLLALLDPSYPLPPVLSHPPHLLPPDLYNVLLLLDDLAYLLLIKHDIFHQRQRWKREEEGDEEDKIEEAVRRGMERLRDEMEVRRWRLRREREAQTWEREREGGGRAWEKGWR
ncbi:hypothetical protein JCM8547_007438 [Rhodosporidiobolus lusitaniae]